MRSPSESQLTSSTFAQTARPAETKGIAVAPQYDTTHVYVSPQDFDRFVASLIATFGGTTTKQGVFTVTPTPSSNRHVAVGSDPRRQCVGCFSGSRLRSLIRSGGERTGYLVTDMDEAIRAAKATGADVLVAPFNDPYRSGDAIIQWPGGVNTQLYWHTTAAPSYASLQTIPENRVYVSADRAEAFVRKALSPFLTGVSFLMNRARQA